jgi:hypothetical protein
LLREGFSGPPARITALIVGPPPGLRCRWTGGPRHPGARFRRVSTGSLGKGVAEPKQTASACAGGNVVCRGASRPEVLCGRTAFFACVDPILASFTRSPSLVHTSPWSDASRRGVEHCRIAKPAYLRPNAPPATAATAAPDPWFLRAIVRRAQRLVGRLVMAGIEQLEIHSKVGSILARCDRSHESLSA